MAVMRIKARGGGVAWALIDNADLDRLGKFNWLVDRDGYAYRMETADEYRGRKRRKVKLHRELLGLQHGDERQGDHINGVRLDNRRENLRVVEPGRNQRNVHRGFEGSSRHRGVSWTAWRGAWRASVYMEGKNHHLGYFDDEEEAARVAAAFRYEHFEGVS